VAGCGVKFGRKPKLTQHQIAEAIKRREAGEALTEIGRSYNVSHSTFEAVIVSLSGYCNQLDTGLA
jgi:Helix-turn-helix domain of resolvase